MSTLKRTIAVLSITLLFCWTATARQQDDKKEKEKPKDAATLNDEEQTLTTTSDDKTKTKKIELKYYLQVSGYFDKDGFNIEKVTKDGPATQLRDDDGNGGVTLEAGDIILELDGFKVTTPEEYAKAINGVGDHEKVKLKIRDKNTGNDVVFYATARKR
jgi:S1-C subfamily serine protease